jgi:uncharacterized membrane-anchored protein
MKTNIVMVLTGLGILFLINMSIWQKQLHLNEGEVIYLELAPVDPRSLMQGDYMALRFAMSNKIYTAFSGQEISQVDGVLEDSWNVDMLVVNDGYVVVKKDENQVAQFVRLENEQPITKLQRKLQFRMRNDRVKFATNAFFFEEGDEPLYRNAQYGVFRLNKKGEVLLTGMLDEQYNLLGEN